MARKRIEALRLYGQGLDYDTIAERLGYTGVSRKATAYNLIQASLKQFEHRAVEDARVLAGNAIDALADAAWNSAVGEENMPVVSESGQTFMVPKPILVDVKAAAIYIETQRRKAKLFGLDAPTKIETSDPNKREELEKIIEEKLTVLAALRAAKTKARKAPRKA